MKPAVRLPVAGVLAVLLAAGAGPTANAATPGEDAYDRLGVAVALENGCSLYRGFEGWFLYKAWAAQYDGSNVDREVAAARAAAGGLGKIIASAEAGERTRAEALKRYQVRAKTLGCQSGVEYLRDGKIAASTMIGSAMMTAQINRVKEPLAPGLTLLSSEQRALHSAYVALIKADFGPNLPLVEQQMGGMAQQRMRQYQAQIPVMAATMQQRDHDEAFGLIRLESMAQANGYQPRLVTLTRTTPLDLPVLEWRKAGSPTLRFQQVPVRLRLTEGGAPKGHVYAVLAVRRGGGSIIGVFGEDTSALSGKLLARFTNSGGTVSVDLNRSAADCPFDVCFGVPDALLTDPRSTKAIAVVSLEQPVKSYANESNVVRLDQSAISTVLKP